MVTGLFVLFGEWVFQPLLVPAFLTLGYGMLVAWFVCKSCNKDRRNAWWLFFLLGVVNYVFSTKEITDFLYDSLIKLGSNATLHKKVMGYLKGKLDGVSFGFVSYMWPEDGDPEPLFLITAASLAAQADEKVQEFKQTLESKFDRAFDKGNDLGNVIDKNWDKGVLGVFTGVYKHVTASGVTTTTAATTDGTGGQATTAAATTGGTGGRP